MARILVVENEPNLRKMIKANLGASGYDVLLSGTGREGLDQVERCLPDLILLDIMLPDISGWEVLRVIRASERWRDIPVLIMSAAVQTAEHLEKAALLGPLRYLPKPFGTDDLLQQIVFMLKD